MTRLLISQAAVCATLFTTTAYGQFDSLTNTFLGSDSAAAPAASRAAPASTSSSILSFFSSNPFTDIVASASTPSASDALATATTPETLLCQSLDLLGLTTSDGTAVTTCGELQAFASLQDVLPAAMDDVCRWRELPSPTTQKGMDECVLLTAAQVTAARKEDPESADAKSTSTISLFPSFLTDFIGGSSTKRASFDPSLPLCCRAAVDGNSTLGGDVTVDTTNNADDSDDDETMPAPTSEPASPMPKVNATDEGPQCEVDCLLFDDGGCRACLCDQGVAKECITYGARSATCREAEGIPKLSKHQHAELLHRAEVELVKSLHDAFSVAHGEQELRSPFPFFSSPGSARCLVRAPATPVDPTPTTAPELPLNPICTTGCSNFFDGCNTCQCDPSNPFGPARCTRKACPPEAIFDTPFCVDDDGRTSTPEPTTTSPPSDCEELVCTAQYDPVCGTDGVTYSNTCQLGIAQCKDPESNIAIASQGVCPGAE